MPDSSELLNNIAHYQKSLDRYSQSRNDVKLMHCILKLYNMPITVSHLTSTGIGRTVNSLRKLGGEVADSANTLVAKWKEMVSGKDDDDDDDGHNSTNISQNNRRDNESNSSHRHSDKYKNSERREKSSKNTSHGSSDKNKYDERHSQSTSDSRHNSSSTSRHNSTTNSKHTSSTRNRDQKTSESGIDSSQSELSSSDEKQAKFNKHEDDRQHNHRESKHKESSTERSSSHKRDSGKDRKRDRSHSKTKVRNNESRSDHKEKRICYSSSSSSSSDSDDKYDGDNSGSSSGNKRKYDSSSTEEETEKKISKRSLSHDIHRSSSSSHKSKDSRTSTSSRDSKRETKPESSRKDSKSSSKNESKSDKKKHDSHIDDRSTSKEKSKKESSTKSDKNSKEKSISKPSSKSSTSSNGGSKKVVAPIAIGSESGTSFADALGMLEPTTSKVSSKKSRGSEPSYKPEKPFIEKVKEKPGGERSTKNDKVEIIIPPPPPKLDLDLNIASLLPAITPNYRPVSNPFLDNSNAKSRVMNDDEALSMVMSQKNLRTKVYSGNKCLFGNVPSLFELCLRVLQDNIDALEYTGGVPFSILKPILDKATPDQLFTLEHHNPYLIEDTDQMWQFHCQKEFRSKKRQELESWREMYMRCLDEREIKLKTLTENIKLTQVKSIPVRQTKLAYVDSHSVVKPPRDVIRKQVKNGIDKKPAITPSSRLSGTTSGSGAKEAPVPVPNPVRASSGGSSSTMKPKKAPLMQKTLALLKGGRYRR